MKKGKTESSSQRIGHIKKVAAKARQALAGDPNVISVGYGIKLIKGRPVRKWSIIVGVREKLKTDKEIEARGSKRIPKEFEGVPTDVVVALTKPVSNISGPRGNVFSELAGGIAVGYPTGVFTYSYGTLGMIVFDKTTNEAMILTNWHVIHEGRNIGDPVHQPAWDDSKIVHSFEIESCPDRVMKVTDSPTNLSDIFGPLAAGTAAAAAYSDEVDPVRFSQGKTPPTEDEQTIGEEINLKLKYPQPPLPGLSYVAEAEWDYTRRTTGKTYHHSHKWKRKNQHVLKEFILKVDKDKYKHGETVIITAALQSPRGKHCGSYYVVAYILSPDQKELHPVVLHWVNQSISPGMASMLKTYTAVKPIVDTICADFEDEFGKEYTSTFEYAGITWIPNPGDILRVVSWVDDGTPGLNWRKGVTVNLPSISNRVVARVATGTQSPVKMTAYFQGQKIRSTEMKGFKSGVSQEIEVTGDMIDQVRLEGGGGEGVLVRLCYNPIQVKERRCIYRGYLGTHAKLPRGQYKVYGLVQTVNDAKEGDKATHAATIIGGIMANQNPQSTPQDPCDWRVKEDTSFNIE
ncbi:MAG: hypothetical protein ACETWK_14885 [Candidatus Aminicenantaceae bacterium]